VIGYGAWEAGGDAWGPNESEGVVVEAIQAGLDAGIDWIDTAEVYGNGVSERLVGKAIQGRRDEVVVATKVAPQPEGSGFRSDTPSPYTSAVSIQSMPESMPARMASITTSSDSLGPHWDPPASQAPKPMTEISGPRDPSRRVRTSEKLPSDGHHSRTRAVGCSFG
jgi:methylglyoxal reductase